MTSQQSGSMNISLCLCLCLCVCVSLPLSQRASSFFFNPTTATTTTTTSASRSASPPPQTTNCCYCRNPQSAEETRLVQDDRFLSCTEPRSRPTLNLRQAPTALCCCAAKQPPLRSAFSPASLRVFEEAKTFFARGGPRLSSPHTRNPKNLTAGQFPPSRGSAPAGRCQESV